jgi:hypothetical protein
LGFLHEVGKFSVLGEITLNRRKSSRMQDLTNYLFPYSHDGHSPTKGHKLDPEKHKSAVREKSPNMLENVMHL